MSVVSRDARRRWAVVAAGVAVACLLPALIAAWPVPRVQTDPIRLRELILASAGVPYQGYVDSRGKIGLPDLPAVSEVRDLLSGATTSRAWYASPQSWRVAVLDPTGETDIYRTAVGTYAWHYEHNLMTVAVGDLPVRLPWAADFLPPDFARRLLGFAAAGDPLSAIPTRRVAGIAAAGLRLTPADGETTIGHVDIWADPSSGLPLQVEIVARGGSEPVFTSRFLEITLRAPQPEVVAPVWPESAGFTVTTGQDVAAAINSIANIPLPTNLAGRARATVGVTRVAGVGAYGEGFSTFVVLALPGRTGGRSLRAARDSGALPVEFAEGQGYEISTPLLNALIVASEGDRATRRTYLVAGTVSPSLLRQAGEELLTFRPGVQ